MTIQVRMKEITSSSQVNKTKLYATAVLKHIFSWLTLCLHIGSYNFCRWCNICNSFYFFLDGTISITFDQQPISNPQCNSKTSKALQIVLGNSQEIRDLEKQRNNYCKNKTSRYYRSRYESALANIQTLVLKVITTSRNIVKEWEKKTFNQTGSLPDPNHYSNIPELKDVIHKQKVAMKLLASWKITVHL